ncbi:hypothetical protein PINS_up021353 [Pythium insidiosum]|nr:hypothetical protein PINS_up021353 [Pythium insidiosum]
MIMGLLVIFFQRYFQRHTRLLMLICLIGQVSALLDTTAAGTYVSERNVWVQFIFSLGITSSTGIGFLESTVVLVVSSIFFIILAWARFAMGEVNTGGVGCQKITLSSPGTVSAAVVLYSILLAFLAWNWEYEERRDFVFDRAPREGERYGADDNGDDGLVQWRRHGEPKQRSRVRRNPQRQLPH